MLKKMILVLPFLLLCAVLFRGLQLNPQETPSAKIGQKIPELMVHQAKSKAVFPISNWYGKPFVIHFFASWCENCELEMPKLLAWQKQYDVRILGVDYKDTPQAFNQWMELWGSGFSGWFMDKTGSFGFDLGVVATPETFLIDAQGQVFYRIQGPLTEAIIHQELQPKWEALHAQ